MSASQLFKAGPVKLNGGSAITLAGNSGMEVNTGFKDIQKMAAGQVSPSFVACLTNEPLISFSCTDLDTLVNAGLTIATPLYVASGQTFTSVDVYATAVAQGGTIGGSSTHFKISMTECMIVMKSCGGTVDKAAEAKLDFHALYDGTNAPITYTTLVSLPATPVISSLFTMGPARVNGSTLTAIVGAEIDAGVTITKVISDGDIYPSLAYVDEIKPKIVLTCKDASQLNTFGLNGTAQGATASMVYFEKIAKGATRVANGTAAHIKVLTNASDGMIWVENASLQEKTGDCKIHHCPTVDASNSTPVSMTVATIT
jgi:hypothetical protein